MVKVKVRLEDDIEELFTYRIDEIIMTKEKDPKYSNEAEVGGKA